MRAIIDLGIAQEVGRDLVQVAELAAHQEIPIKFLEQIMLELRTSGFVESRRGKYGGYRLLAPPDHLTIGAVIRAIEGPLAPIKCVSQTAYEPCTCPDEDHCGLRMLMMDVRNAITGILDRYTLANVVEVTLRKIRRDNLPLPFAVAPGSAREGSRSRTSSGRRSAGPVTSIVDSLLKGISP